MKKKHINEISQDDELWKKPIEKPVLLEQKPLKIETKPKFPKSKFSHANVDLPSATLAVSELDFHEIKSRRRKEFRRTPSVSSNDTEELITSTKKISKFTPHNFFSDIGRWGSSKHAKPVLSSMEKHLMKMLKMNSGVAEWEDSDPQNQFEHI